MITELWESGTFSAPIVTTLQPLNAFHKAEDYHQNFAIENPTNPYVRSITLPKIEKVRETCSDMIGD